VALRITKLNLLARMEYRSDFVTALVLGLAWQSSVLVFAGVLLARFPGIGGWNEGSVLLIASIRLLAHGIETAVFGGLWYIRFAAQDGLVDVYLLRPLPVFRQMLLSVFPINAFGDTTAAVLLFGLALAKLHLVWTLWKVLYLVAAVLGGMFTEAAMLTVVAALSLRYRAGNALYSWVDTINGQFGNYPLRILPTPAQIALTYLLPVAFIAYLPAAVLTGRVGSTGVLPWLAVGSPVVGLGLYVLTRCLWFLGLRHYESSCLACDLILPASLPVLSGSLPG